MQVQANWWANHPRMRIILIAIAGIVIISALIVLQQWIINPKMTLDSAGLVMLDGLIDWTVWALLTPGIVWLARRFPMFRRGRPQPAILIHGVVGTLATAIWSVPISVITWLFTLYGFDGMKPMALSSAYLYELQGRSFYYSLFYWLVVGIVTARLLARDAQEAAAEAARLESEALAADLHAARVHYDPRGLAGHLRTAAELAEADPVRAEEQILETAGELQRSLALTSPVTQQRPCAA
ncbi:hypothetical protein [Sphingomonas caeni]|uniref:hypothetical protein n=1 Tax=Sphingomonas caeni TaxID=2984949 RepID=UPI002230EA82|nr:hypothetical protein [Sphingomonas caeni]